MKRFLFPVAAALLAVSHPALADGFAWPGTGPIPPRLPATAFRAVSQDPQVAKDAIQAPATSAPIVSSYEGYPFANGCCNQGNPCCDGIWSGYVRKCHPHLHLHHRHCGCASGCGYGGGCFGGSFAGGCGSCGCGGWGLHGHHLHGCGKCHGLLHHCHHGLHRLWNKCCVVSVGCGTVVNGCDSSNGGKAAGDSSMYPPIPSPEQAPTTATSLGKSAARPLYFRGPGTPYQNW
jgi:hypothetical protein